MLNYSGRPKYSGRPITKINESCLKPGTMFSWMIDGGDRYPSGLVRVVLASVKKHYSHNGKGDSGEVDFVWYEIIDHPRFRRGEIRSCRADVFLRKVEKAQLPH